MRVIMNQINVPQSVISASNLTEKQLEDFIIVSQSYCDENNIEPLTAAGFIQAIDNLAYHTTLIAFSHVLDPNYIGRLEGKIDQLDTALYNTAFASGVHVLLVNIMVDIRCQYYMEMFEPML